MVACNKAPPFITSMIPAGFSDNGIMTYRMTGLFAEVFNNLQVIVCQFNFTHK